MHPTPDSLRQEKIREQTPQLEPPNTRIVSFYIQKGGVGKTTGVETTATALAALGRKVAVIDTDRQASLSNMLDLRTIPSSRRYSMTDVILRDIPLLDAMYQAKHNLWLVPADTNINAASEFIVTHHTPDIMSARLSQMLSRLSPPPQRHRPKQLPFRIRDLPIPQLLSPDQILELPDYLDYILIDHAPNPMALGDSCLAISHEIWAPVLLEPLAVQGLVQMIATVTELFKLRDREPPKLRGIIPSRVNHGPMYVNESLAKLHAYFPGLITRAVHNANEIPIAQGQDPPQTVFEYARASRPSKEFVDIALQLDGSPGTLIGSPECGPCQQIKEFVEAQQTARRK